MLLGSFHAIATYLSTISKARETALEACPLHVNLLRMATSRYQLIVLVRESDTSVCERLANWRLQSAACWWPVDVLKYSRFELTLVADDLRTQQVSDFAA